MEQAYEDSHVVVVHTAEDAPLLQLEQVYFHAIHECSYFITNFTLPPAGDGEILLSERCRAIWHANELIAS